MDPDAAFLAGYAVALVGLAAGLVVLGQRSTDPWSSKVLAASRPPASERTDEQASWLHTDVPAFHLCLSAVALTAAVLLTAVNAVLHHRPLEVAVHFTLLAIITKQALLVHRHRSGLPRSAGVTQENRSRMSADVGGRTDDNPA